MDWRTGWLCGCFSDRDIGAFLMRNVWRLKTHHVDPDAALRWMRLKAFLKSGEL
jgi:hypothetical protein